MSKPLRVLIVEDSAVGAELMLRQLRTGGYDVVSERVQAAAAMRAALKRGGWDLVISDHHMPRFSGPDALRLLRLQAPEIPLIMVSGVVGEESAAAVIRAGAEDFLLKDNLNRLAAVVERVLRDVEERRGRQRAELAMHQSEELYRRLFETESDAVFLVDAPTGRFIDANTAALHLYGYSRQELLLMSAPDVSAEPEKTKETILSQTTKISLRWHRKRDGTVFPVEISGSYFALDGRKLHVAAIRDITERRKVEDALRASEERYRRLYECMMDAYVSVDMTGRIQEFNPAFQTILGYSADELRQMTYEDLTPEKWHAFEAGIVANQILSRGHSEVYEKEYRRKDGSVFPVELRTFLIRDDAGQPVGMWAIVRDITERKRAEAELEASRKVLRVLAASSRTARELERTRIAREVHDELGHAFADLKFDLAWLDRRLKENGAPNRTSLRRRIAAMIKRVETHLDAARRIATELRPAVLDSLGLVAAMEWAAKQFELRTRIACELDLPPDAPALGAAQSTALFRIFQETLANVAHHAGASRVRVRLATEGGHVTLEVSDNGRGISAREAADPQATGLMGMRERALEFDGAVAVHGAPGKGTSVRVTIPLDHL